MSTPLRHPSISRAAPRSSDWKARVRQLWIAAFVIVAGTIVGMQIVRPDRRVLQLVAAAAILIAAVRLPSFASLLFLVFAIPLRKTTTYGGTTLAFSLVIFIVWLARVALRAEPRPRRTPIDMPVLALLGAYILSFIQLEHGEAVRYSIFETFSAFTYVFLCFLVIHLVNTERQLRQLVFTILAMAFMVHVFAIVELVKPGITIVPQWIDFAMLTEAEMERYGFEYINLRVGSLFHDYELLAEFCAMTMILIAFAAARAEGRRERIASLTLLALNGGILFATGTRGAIVALAVGIVYLLAAARPRPSFRQLAIWGGAGTLLTFVGTQVLLSFTKVANVFDRFSDTKFQGVVPDTRLGTWTQTWERIVDKPIFGHGLYYSFREGVTQYYWPHNNYLYYWYLLGIIGLATFLWVLWRLWRSTAHAERHFRHSSYAGGLLFALQGMLIVMMIDHMKIDYLRSGTYSYWVWCFFGLIVATAKVHGDSARLRVSGAAV
jgi:O-antigen ligase